MMLWPLLLGVHCVPQAGKGRAHFPECRGRSPDHSPFPRIGSLAHQYTLFFKFSEDVEIKRIFIRKKPWDQETSLVLMPLFCRTQK